MNKKRQGPLITDSPPMTANPLRPTHTLGQEVPGSHLGCIHDGTHTQDIDIVRDHVSSADFIP